MKPDEGYWRKEGTLVELMRSQWGNKTLESFRLESDKRPDGGLWEAIRSQSDGRLAIMLCATKADDVAAIEEALLLPKEAEDDDWESMTLLDLFMDSKDQEAIYSCKSNSGRRTALILLVQAADASPFRFLDQNQFFFFREERSPVRT